MSLLQEMEKYGLANEGLSDQGMKNLARYLADYLIEEYERGNLNIDSRFHTIHTLYNGIEAWHGGAQ